MKIKRCLRMNDCCRKTKRSGGRLRETLCQRAATNYLEPIRINAKMQSILEWGNKNNKNRKVRLTKPAFSSNWIMPFRTSRLRAPLRWARARRTLAFFVLVRVIGHHFDNRSMKFLLNTFKITIAGLFRENLSIQNLILNWQVFWLRLYFALCTQEQLRNISPGFNPNITVLPSWVPGNRGKQP